jgi:hypothetical protein
MKLTKQIDNTCIALSCKFTQDANQGQNEGISP